MDIMKIESRFMRGVVAKALNKFIFKSTGYKVETGIKHAEVKIVDGVGYIHLDFDASIDQAELQKVLDSIF